MKKFLLLFLLVSFNSLSQSIWTNPITGTNPSTSNPYTTGQAVNTNITVSGIGRGFGIAAATADNRYSANSWNTASFDPDAYFVFTLTPNSGCQINFTSFVYTGQASATGPTSFAIRSSVDGYAANIGAPTVGGGTTIDLSSATYQNISGAITFRFYGWGASGATGTFSINDFTFNGTTSCGAPSNTITTGAITGAPFAVDCSTTDAGSIAFTSSGTFDAGNVYTAQLSDETGDFTFPTVLGTGSTSPISITIPAGTAAGNLYRIRIVSNDPATIGTDNGTNITITNNCSITTGTVSASSFSVSCSAGTNGTVAFTASGTMQAGNLYSAQLSNASGNFTSSTTIGTISSTASSGTISFTIPSSIPTGSGYLIRVIASTPSTTGTSSSAITITLTNGPCVQEPPRLTSVIINSCDPTCAEGFNEIVFGTSGDYSFTVNTSNFDFLYGSTNPGTNYTDVLVNNAAGINQLNTAAGCPGLFVDAFGTTVPANASWLLVYTDICEEALSWSGLCGSGPIYVIFQNDANWSTAGNFANNPSAASPLRYFRSGITTTSGSTFTINYTIDGDQYPDSDGVYATFDTDGGAAVAYGDNDCILSPTLLPSSLLSFNGEYNNATTELSWQTVSEQNNSHFTVSHSSNGKQFSVLGTVTGAGNSSELLDYRFVHSFPHPGMNYYKLHSTDYDGKTYEKGITAIYAEFSFSFYDTQTATIELYYESDIEIYSTDGKLIHAISETKSIPFHQSGLFFILDKRSGITERLFVP